MHTALPSVTYPSDLGYDDWPGLTRYALVEVMQPGAVGSALVEQMKPGAHVEV